jgi:hypothetical protein
MKLEDLPVPFLEDVLNSKLSERECAEVLAAKVVNPEFMDHTDLTEQMVRNKGLLASIILANARQTLKKNNNPETTN